MWEQVSDSSISGFWKANIHTKVDHTMKWRKWSPKIVCIFVWGHHYYTLERCANACTRNGTFAFHILDMNSLRPALCAFYAIPIPFYSWSILKGSTQIPEGVIRAGAVIRSGKRVLLALSKSAGVWPTLVNHYPKKSPPVRLLKKGIT